MRFIITPRVALRATLLTLYVVAFSFTMLGCSASQKAAATRVVNATTQPTRDVQNAALAVAAVTSPGTPPNSLAATLAAMAGLALLIEKGVVYLIAALPNSKSSPSGLNSPLATGGNDGNNPQTAATPPPTPGKPIAQISYPSAA